MAKCLIFTGSLEQAVSKLGGVFPELGFLSQALAIELGQTLLQAGCPAVSVQPPVESCPEKALLDLHVPMIDEVRMAFVKLGALTKQVCEVFE